MNSARLLLLLIFLSGCAAKDESSRVITPAETVLLACSGFTSALQTAWVAYENNKIGKKGLVKIKSVINYVDPICDAPPPEVDATALETVVTQGTAVIMSVLAAPKEE